jgi:sterol 24-C-methyltransferase
VFKYKFIFVNLNYMNYYFLFIILILFCYIFNIYVKNNDKIQAFFRLYNKTDEQTKNYIDSYEQLYSRKIKPQLNDLNDFKNNVSLKGFNPTERTEGTEELYRVLHDIIILGNLDKMYVPPLLGKTTGIIENQLLIEKKMADYLNVKPNELLLEIGCGSGAIAMNMNKNTKCNIIGINIDEDTLSKGRKKLKDSGNNQITLKYQDLNKKLDFSNNSIDGVYQIQAMTFSEDLTGVLKEFYRVLKPGKKVVFLEGVLLDNFDKNNEKDIERGLNVRGITAGGGIWHVKYWEKAAEDAGFKIIKSTCGDKYDNHYSPELPVLKDITAFFFDLRDWISTLTQWKILPKNLKILFDRVTKGGEDLIKLMEEAKITTDYIFVFEKPDSSKS